MATSTSTLEYYENNYRNYDLQNPPRKLRFYADVVARYVAPAAPRRIHDIGCAFGRFLGSLDRGWEIFGSDLNQPAIEQAARELPHGTFKVAGATEVPFAERFGAVTAFDVIEHVADLRSVAAAVEEQLCDGGLFVFVVPVYDGLSGPIVRRLDHDPTHVHKWPRRRWIEWARAHFDVLEWRGIVRYLLPFGYYVHFVTRSFRLHAPAILVVCRKRGPARTPA
jgi:SAM-dependent methyltransferase